jgi:CRP-like cAMP-binding protein
MTHPEILLKQVPLFRSLPAEESQRLATLLRKQVIRKGEILFRKGDEGTALYMIVSGKIKIVRQSRDGDEAILALLTGGDFCGEMSLLDDMPRSADAIAVEETHLYALNRRDFLLYVLNNETAVRAILGALSKRLRKADDFLEDIFFLSVPSRLTKKLVELAEAGGSREGASATVQLTVTQKELAGMIGATRESINKALRALREKGLISLSGSTLLIQDMEALKRKVR